MASHEKHHHINYIEFPSENREHLARSRAFFGDVFGWKWQMWGDDYADTHESGVSCGLTAAEERSPTPLVVMYSADLEATRARVLEAGGSLTRDIFEFPGGRRFHFREPGGIELAVWSDVDVSHP